MWKDPQTEVVGTFHTLLRLCRPLLGCGNVVVGAGRSGLHIDNHRVIDVDQVVEPVTELNTLVRLRGPGLPTVDWRNHFWQLVIGVGSCIIARRPPASGVPAPASRSRRDLGHDNGQHRLP